MFLILPVPLIIVLGLFLLKLHIFFVRKNCTTIYIYTCTDRYNKLINHEQVKHPL